MTTPFQTPRSNRTSYPCHPSVREIATRKALAEGRLADMARHARRTTWTSAASRRRPGRPYDPRPWDDGRDELVRDLRLDLYLHDGEGLSAGLRAYAERFGQDDPPDRHPLWEACMRPAAGVHQHPYGAEYELLLRVVAEPGADPAPRHRPPVDDPFRELVRCIAAWWGEPVAAPGDRLRAIQAAAAYAGWRWVEAESAELLHRQTGDASLVEKARALREATGRSPCWTPSRPGSASWTRWRRSRCPLSRRRVPPPTGSSRGA